jgi:hypothetical protein
VLAAHVAATVAGERGRAVVAPPLRWLGLGEPITNRRDVPALLSALTVPALLYGAVNQARFGHPWRLPIADQIATQIDPIRPKIFATTGGSLFAPKFLPSAALAAFRPDGIAFSGVFPWVTFPARAHPLGGITFAAIDPAASLPASMPFLFVLAIVGAVAAFRPRHVGDRGLAPLRVLVIGGVFGALGVVTIPFVNQRYLSDFLPVLVTLALAGLHVTTRAVDGRRPEPGGRRRAVLGALAVLAVFSVFANFGLALLYQRAYSPFTDASERAAFIRFQQKIDERLPGGTHLTVKRGDELPDPLAAGTLFVVGDCAGVYWSDGSAWQPVERTQATGRFPLHLILLEHEPGTRETIYASGSEGDETRLELEYLRGHRVRFRVGPFVGEPRVFAPGGSVDVEIIADRSTKEMGVAYDGDAVFGLGIAPAPGNVEVVGRRDTVRGLADRRELDFSGQATLLDTPAPFCHALTQDG